MEYVIGGLIGVAIFVLSYLPFLIWEDVRRSRWSRWNKESWQGVARSVSRWTWQRGYERGYADRDAEMGTD